MMHYRNLVCIDIWQWKQVLPLITFHMSFCCTTSFWDTPLQRVGKIRIRYSLSLQGIIVEFFIQVFTYLIFKCHKSLYPSVETTAKEITKKRNSKKNCNPNSTTNALTWTKSNFMLNLKQSFNLSMGLKCFGLSYRKYFIIYHSKNIFLIVYQTWNFFVIRDIN